ncbi:hypothetical protein C0Q70_20484 [Pomacea canaliculata]|uniref:Ig-like domain-containing protein n=1 Tax=Pomacea canaliculata TaxID=400727 RepID=A0A2T7NFP7_POMCA|nr:hypothetical protein C0Q70_20484 [Pomacea canaliculata]
MTSPPLALDFDYNSRPACPSPQRCLQPLLALLIEELECDETLKEPELTTLLLTCLAYPPSVVQIVWRRASEPNPLTIGEDTFVGDKRFYVRHRKHSLEWNLHIREATPQDSGVYECQVITRSRDIRQMVLLRIDGELGEKSRKTVGERHNGSQFVEKGNTLTLTCNATGFDYPPDELDWFKDGLKLTSDLRRTLRKDVSLADKTIVSKLQVARATMADAGTYVCRASDMQVTSAKNPKTSPPSGRSDRGEA